jgi:hypothetical protein
VAWNEDTVNSYQILLLTGQKFSYTIVKKHREKIAEEYYKGSFEFRNDTFFLKYHRGLQPMEVTNYLIREASGNYLIQPFSNSKKQMFLRFQKFYHL